MFYYMFYFTCDRTFTPQQTDGQIVETQTMRRQERREQLKPEYEDIT